MFCFFALLHWLYSLLIQDIMCPMMMVNSTSFVMWPTKGRSGALARHFSSEPTVLQPMNCWLWRMSATLISWWSQPRLVSLRLALVARTVSFVCTCYVSFCEHVHIILNKTHFWCAAKGWGNPKRERGAGQEVGSPAAGKGAAGSWTGEPKEGVWAGERKLCAAQKRESSKLEKNQTSDLAGERCHFCQ